VPRWSPRRILPRRRSQWRFPVVVGAVPARRAAAASGDAARAAAEHKGAWAVRPRPTVVGAVPARWAPFASVMIGGDTALAAWRRCLAAVQGGARGPRRNGLAWRAAPDRLHSPRHSVPVAAATASYERVRRCVGAVPAHWPASLWIRCWLGSSYQWRRTIEAPGARTARGQRLAHDQHPGAPQAICDCSDDHTTCRSSMGIVTEPLDTPALCWLPGTALMTTGRSACKGSVASGTVLPDAPGAACLHLHAQRRLCSWTDGANGVSARGGLLMNHLDGAGAPQFTARRCAAAAEILL